MNRRQLSNMAFGIEEDCCLSDNDLNVDYANNEGESIVADEEAHTAEDTMNTLVNDEHTLQEMYGVVQEGIETTDGIDSATAAVVQEAVENIYRRHGLRKRIPMRISKESFNTNRLSSANRLKVSIEGLWDTIKEGIKKIWEWIKSLWRKIWGISEKKAETAKEMAEQIIAISEKYNITDATIPLPSDGSQDISMSAMANNFSNMAKKIEDEYKNFGEQLDSIIAANKLKFVELKFITEEFDYGDVATVTIKGSSDAAASARKFLSVMDQIQRIIDKNQTDIDNRISKLEELSGKTDKAEKTDGNGQSGGFFGKLKEALTKERHIPGFRYAPTPQNVIKKIKEDSLLLAKNTDFLVKKAGLFIKIIYSTFNGIKSLK